MSEGWVRTTVGSFLLEVTWRVSPGEVLVLFGPSGAGKTMTLRVVAGLLRPQHGHIQVGDDVVFDSHNHWWIASHQRKVGYVPQHYGLFPHLRIRDNIAYGLMPRSASNVKERVINLVETLRLADVVDKYPVHLSGGPLESRSDRQGRGRRSLGRGVLRTGVVPEELQPEGGQPLLANQVR